MEEASLRLMNGDVTPSERALWTSFVGMAVPATVAAMLADPRGMTVFLLNGALVSAGLLVAAIKVAISCRRTLRARRRRSKRPHRPVASQDRHRELGRLVPRGRAGGAPRDARGRRSLGQPYAVPDANLAGSDLHHLGRHGVVRCGSRIRRVASAAVGRDRDCRNSEWGFGRGPLVWRLTFNTGFALAAGMFSPFVATCAMTIDITSRPELHAYGAALAATLLYACATVVLLAAAAVAIERRLDRERIETGRPAPLRAT